MLAVADARAWNRASRPTDVRRTGSPRCASARHLATTIGRDRPLVLVGYSNGGALVLSYALDALERSADPQAERIILLSPMIGVAPFACG